MVLLGSPPQGFLEESVQSAKKEKPTWTRMELDGKAQPSIPVETEAKDACSGKGGSLGNAGEALW